MSIVNPKTGETVTTLKPCPFCGSPVESDINQAFLKLGTGQPSSAVSLYCTSCAANMTLPWCDYPHLTVVELFEYAANQWNERMP